MVKFRFLDLYLRELSIRISEQWTAKWDEGNLEREKQNLGIISL